MKSQELRDQFYDPMDSAIRQHCIDAIGSLYKDASVGDNRLEIEADHQTSYSDGAEYTITGVEMMFNDNPKGKMVFYQTEEDSELEDSYTLDYLETDSLLDLLDAVEKTVGSHYECGFYIQPTIRKKKSKG